jgi:hypothetical protein
VSASHPSVPARKIPRGAARIATQLATFSFLTGALFFAIGARAAPPVLEETTRLAPPEPDYFWKSSWATSTVAVDGDRIIAAAYKPFVAYFPEAIFLFERRSNEAWTPVKLFERNMPDEPSERTLTADIKGAIAAVVAGGQLMVYERGAGGWIQSSNLTLPGGHAGSDVVIGNGFIVVGSVAVVNGVMRSVGLVYHKNAVGQWSYWTRLVANPTGGFAHETYAANVALSGNSVLLTHNNALSGSEVEVTAHVFEGTPGAWTNTAILRAPPNFKPLANAVIDGNYVLWVGAPIAGPAKTAVFVKSGGSWTYDTSRTQIGSPEQSRIDMTDIAAISAAGGTALIGLYTDEDRGSEGGSIMVYKRGVNGEPNYQPIAELLASNSWQQLALGNGVDISGNRVVTMSGDGSGIYIYQLPVSFSQPAVFQDDFQDNDANGWLSSPANAWSVATSGTSRVYRQSNLTGEASSARGDLDWTDQSIGAYIKPAAVSGEDRWVGLVVRQSDANNYYYATLRSSGVVQIKKMVNGSFVTLASAQVPFTLNRTYRLRLEAIGTWVKVFVDGAVRAEAQDSSLTHGQPGLRSYRVAADYDNVVVTPNPSIDLLWDHFDIYPYEPQEQQPRQRRQWTTSGSGSWSIDPDVMTYAQTSSAADARAIAGIEVDNIVLDARLKAVSFNGSDRWFGVITRYQDDNNYYYVTLRGSNQISLRRLTNGAITSLDTAPLTVTPGAWFYVRVENIGNALRVYVNDQLLLEANDSTFAKGRYGLATYKAAAEFDDVIVRQP